MTAREQTSRDHASHKESTSRGHAARDKAARDEHAEPDQGVVKDERGQEQPADKKRATQNR